MDDRQPTGEPARREEPRDREPRRGGVSLQWTRDKKPEGRPIPAPPGANDIRFVWRNGVFVRARWTKDGEDIGDPIPVPEGANDAHLDVAGS